jgi:hypothetical protein
MTKKYIKRNERHIRWNWETSPDNTNDGNSMVRYHFVVVGDKGKKAVIERLLYQIQIRGAIIPVNSFEGSVRDSDFRFLYESYDSVVSPRMISFSICGKKVKRDRELYERQSSSGIETYVRTLLE